jgi:hypothetical protein
MAHGMGHACYEQLAVKIRILPLRVEQAISLVVWFENVCQKQYRANTGTA